MNGRQDQIILVQHGRAGELARGLGRIERELRQEALAGAGLSRRCVRAAAGRRRAPAPHRAGVRGAVHTIRAPVPICPATVGLASASEPINAANAGQDRARAAAAAQTLQARPGMRVSPRTRRTFRRRWPARCPASTAARETRRCGSSGCLPSAAAPAASFTCAASRNFRPPYFTYGILRRTSSSSSTSAMMRATEQHRLALERHAALACLEHARHHVLRLTEVVEHRHIARPRARAAPGSQRLRYWRSPPAISAFAASRMPWVER